MRNKWRGLDYRINSVTAVGDELRAVLRELNDRLSDLEQKRDVGHRLLRDDLLNRCVKLEAELAQVRETNVRLGRENQNLVDSLDALLAHSCKPPLGNPTREEAIEALRKIVRTHEAWHDSDVPLIAGQRMSLLLKLADIARAALPKTGDGPETASNLCSWPRCASEAVCRSGNFGDQLVCSVHLQVTNGTAHVTLLEIQRVIDDAGYEPCYETLADVRHLVSQNLPKTERES
jgi:hypothetical protein